MLRLLPPAGAPVSLAAVVRAAFSSVSAPESRRNLQKLVMHLSGKPHCFFFNSGKTALLFGLQALSERTGESRNEVIVPAYTCYTVPAAVVRAGLKVRPVDIDPATMDYDYQRLAQTDFSRVLAVIGDNLFGIPSDWAQLRTLAGRHGVFLIDDAAQAMGLECGGRPAGSHGEFGFYSLGRGKNLTTFSGGILVTDQDDLADSIRSSIDDLTTVGGGEVALLIKLILLSLFLRPRLYWIPSMLPFLGLGETVFDEKFAVGRLSNMQIRLAVDTFENLGKYNDRRRDNARRLAGLIRDLPGCRVPGFDSADFPSYLRLPVMMPDAATRAKAVKELRRRGLSASAMYPDSIDRIENLGERLVTDGGEFPGARQVVKRLVTLPTHPYVTDEDIDNTAGVLTAILGKR